MKNNFTDFITPERKLFFRPTVETISKVLNISVSIWLLDDTRQQIHMEAATKDIDSLLTANSLKISKSPVIYRILQKKRQHKENINKELNTSDLWHQSVESLSEKYASALIIPLLIKKEVVGILFLYVRRDREFTYASKAEVIKSFAQQITSTYRQIHSLETLNEVGRLVSSDLQSSSKLFEHIVLSAQKMLECNHVCIFLLDEERQHLFPKASSENGIKQSGFLVGQGLAGQVITLNKSLRVPDTRKNPHFIPGKNTPPNKERSMLLAPVKLQGKIAGVISADKDTLNWFDNHDRMMLESFASHAAIAIQNSHYIQQKQRKTQALTELNSLAQHLISIKESPDTHELLLKIANSAKEVLQADLIELYQYNQKKDFFDLPPISVGVKNDPSIFPEEIYNDDVVRTMLQRSEPFYEKKSRATRSTFIKPYTIERDDVPDQRFVTREKIESTAAIPLIASDEKMGIMFANYRTPQIFSKEQRELIELFANQAAIALKNAELMDKYYEAQNYLRNIIINSPNPIIVIDENGNIKIFSKACQDLWKLPHKQVIGDSVIKYYETEAHARELGKMLWENKGHQIENVDARIKTSDGEIVPIRLSASYLFNETGDRIGSVGVFTDFREMKRLEEEKIEAEKLATLGRVAHTVGHDIKHNIGTVNFYIDTLLHQNNGKKDSKLNEIYAEIKDALWDATSKIQYMLLAGQQKPPLKETVDVETLFEVLKEKVAREAYARKVKFLVKYPIKRCLISVDIEQIRQVLSNLFTNSVYAIETRKSTNGAFKKGLIKVTVEIIDDKLCVTWQDNGSGIPEDDLSKIFNPFFTRKAIDVGSGLGLFIVKNIIENHDGTITVNSEVDKGTRFVMTIPKIENT